MFARSLVAAATLALASCATAPAATPGAQGPDLWTDACTDWDEWDKPGPPYRIHGNTYYVGTCGISSILIAEPEGMILIDSGTKAGAEVVLANIRTLGFDPKDIRFLLHSHEHFDHVGGFARIAAAIRGQIVTSVDAAPVISTGMVSRMDPQFGTLDPMEPLRIHRIVQTGDTVDAGSTTLTAIATPGHSPGALSWHWRSCDNSGCRDIVYADSLSPVSGDGYRFSDHPDYVAEYRAGLARVAETPCDLLLTPHPSSSDMPARLRGEKALVSDTACADYAASISARLDERLAQDNPK